MNINLSIEKKVVAGVYFLYYKKELVYIGQSKNILSRIKQHKDKVFDSFSYIQIDNEKNRNDKEIELIIHYTPKYNMNVPTFYDSDVLLLKRLKTTINNLLYEEIKSLLDITILGNNSYFKKSDVEDICKKMISSIKGGADESKK